MTVDEFRSLLKDESPFEVVRRVLLNGSAAHVADADVEYIRGIIGDAYGVAVDDVEIIITGSAKLGFSLSEKQKKGSPTLPRYRLFSANSDIDVAVISTEIFNKIWLELSRHYSQSVWFPPDTKRLGDYLTTGWLRPDHFPRDVRLPLCENWWNTFRKINRDSRFRMRRMSGGAFQSKEHLTHYLARAVRDCIACEVTP